MVKKLISLASIILVVAGLVSAFPTITSVDHPETIETGEELNIETEASFTSFQNPRIALEWDQRPDSWDSDRKTKHCNSLECSIDWDGTYHDGIVFNSEGTYSFEVQAVEGIDDTDYRTSEIVVRDEQDDPAYFNVEIDDTNSPITEGQELNVDFTVQNTGDSGEGQYIELVADGKVVDDIYKYHSPGYEDSYELNWDTSRGDSDVDSITVRTEDESDSVGVEIDEIEDPAEFDVEITGTNSPVDAGETLEVDYRVENIGGESATKDISLSARGREEDVDQETLYSGESETGTLYWETSDQDIGSRTVEVSTDDSRDSETVSVLEQEETELNLESVSATRYTLDPGDSATLKADVSKEGDEYRFVTIQWFADGIEIGSESRNIPDDSSREFDQYTTYQNLKDEGLETGRDYNLRAKIEGTNIERDSGRDIRLGEESEAAEFKVRSIDTNSPIQAGETLLVDYTVKNIGDRFDSQRVKLMVDGDRVDYIRESLSGGERESGTLRWYTNIDDPGYKDIRVETDDHSLSDTVYIQEKDDDLQAEFDFTPDNPTVGERIDFDASASRGDIVSYRWEFGDGGSSRGERVSHVFHEPGYYEVELEVESDDDRTRTVTDRIYVSASDQKYDLDVIVRDNRGDRISNSRVNVDGRTQYTDYNGKAIFENLKEGFYDVRASKNGESDIKTNVQLNRDRTVYLTLDSKSEIDASFNYNPNNPVEDERIEFDASSSSGDIVSYRWEFEGHGSGSGREVSQVFDDSGYYDVTLSVENADGDTDTVTRTIYVSNKEINADFDYSPNNPQVDDKVRFDASSSSGDIVSYRWGFGDGGSSRGERVSHSFDKSGYYSVELTVEDANGNSNSKTKTIYVGKGQGLEAEFDFTPSDPVEGERVSFDASATRGEIVSYRWEFEGHGSGSGREVSQVFDDSGYYDVTLTVEGSKGKTDTKEDVIYISSKELNAEFDFSPDNPETDESIEFDASDSIGDIVDYRWELDDGSEERGQVVSKTFDNSGYYNVELTVEDTLGNTDSETEVIYVTGDDKREEYDLEVEIVDSEDKDPIEDARVSVDGRTRETDDRGDTDFTLKEGSYDIFASADNYVSETRYVRMDRDREIEIEMDRREDLKGQVEITDVNIPSSVCRGESIEATVNMENNGYDRSINLNVDGIGNNFQRNFYLEDGETTTEIVKLINVDGQGNQEVEFKIDGDRAVKTVRVRDCETKNNKRVSIKASPTQIRIGDSIRVSGYVNDADRGTQVNILVDGTRAGSAITDSAGYYETYITAEDVGKQTVRAGVSGGNAATRIDVLPTAAVISAKSAPDRIFEGEEFEVCGDVESQSTPLVVLKENGEEVDSRYAKGEVCFERRKAPGNYDYTIEAWARGQSSSQSTSVEVMEMDSEVRNFPDQIASVRSGSGMVKVELYNNDKELKAYQISLEGLPDDWTSQSRKEVMLRSGERSTEYIFFNPKEEGNFRATLRVASQGRTIHTEDIGISSGGRKESPSLFDKVVETIVFW